MAQDAEGELLKKLNDGHPNAKVDDVVTVTLSCRKTATGWV